MKNERFVQLLTKEGENFDKHAWNIYPRPQLKRDSFFSLNGEWEFSQDETVFEEIIVPFPPESVLSGIGRRLSLDPTVKYRKTFTLPDDFMGKRILLHFDAVDQFATVILNGIEIGAHDGGYHAFSFDVTHAVKKENLLTVSVTDILSDHTYPYGKQRENRGGMWYTPITGIWQTVWMECVPEEYVKSLKIETFETRAHIRAEGVNEGTVTVHTPKGDQLHPLINGEAIIDLPEPRLWCPEDPYLYYFEVQTKEDRIESYFALRTLEVKTCDGIPRLCLNGKPYFFHGLLDQGYYSDGIYTPASPCNYTRDILEMKDLGFNTLRKHIKIEPEFFYYECDRLGMIVFQDMVNNGDYSFLRDTALPTVGIKRLPDKNMHRNKKTRTAFLQGMKETVEQLYNHPCICYWTIFNEGWGQFDSKSAYKLLKEMDSSRFIDSTSGWFKGDLSDVESLHVYFKPVKIKSSERPIVLSEFGGYSYQPEGHVYNPRKSYGYRFFKKQEEFEDALISLYEAEIIPAIQKGLCAAVYTQVSDIEDETNGLLSYDRRILKVSPARMRSIAEKLKI